MLLEVSAQPTQMRGSAQQNSNLVTASRPSCQTSHYSEQLCKMFVFVTEVSIQVKATPLYLI